VHGEQDEDSRRAVLDTFSNGELDVVCNVAVLTEGYDEPRTSCIIMARPTRSAGLYQQCVGRGTRLSFGKKNCLILDVADVARNHSLSAAVTLGEALGLKSRFGNITSVEASLNEHNAGGIVQVDVGGGREFDPFHAFGDPLSHAGLVRLRWTRGGSGLTLSLPKDWQTNEQAWLVVVRRPDRLFDVVQATRRSGSYLTRQCFINEFGLPDETSAAVFAEHHALQTYPYMTAMAGRDAEWRNRNEQATPGQIDALKKMYRGAMPSGAGGTLTKGEAALLISRKIAEGVRVTIGRAASELEVC
jgi:hypothetical protein